MPQLPTIVNTLRVIAVVLALCTVCPARLACSAERNLIVAPLSLSFGKVQVGTVSAPRAIKLSNRCGVTLTIQSIGPPHGPFAVLANSCGSKLDQCGECDIAVTFNPIATSNPNGAEEAGELAIASTAANSPQVVKLTGIAFGTAPASTTIPTPIPVNKSALSSALFVANGGNYVTVYPLGIDGDAAPISSIDGGATGLSAPAGIALDPRGNIYLLNRDGRPSPSGTIDVYPPGSNGNVDPIATIEGPNTGLKSVKAVAVDSSGKIYAANMESSFGCYGNITVYHATSNGNVNPVATICGDDTHLQNPGGVALDSAGNIYVAEDGGGGPAHKDSAEILIFPPGSNGDSPPIRTITGPNTGLMSLQAIALDSHGNIYVTGNDERGIHGGVGTITVFAAGADGDVKPLAIINGPSPRHVPHMIPIFRLGAIAVDPPGNIYVAGASSDPESEESILVYPPHASGNAKPIATISGDNTAIFGPEGIAIGSYLPSPRRK
jgi:hypothetical protein